MVPLPSRGGRLPLKHERIPRSRATIQKTQFPHPLEIILFPLHGLDWNPDDRLKHEGRGDSPVVPGEKAPKPSVHSTGSLALLLHLEKEAEFHVSTQDEA